MHATPLQRPLPTPEEVENLAAWVSNQYGLAIGASAKANLSTALAMAAAGRRAKPRQIVELAALGDQELCQVFISAVTIHETYFFRHPGQFELLREIAEHRMRTRPRAPLRALSAGCASGEEAYSIAAALDSLSAAVGGSRRIEVLGIDIDRPSLDRARAAQYGRWSIREAIAPWASEALLPVGNGWTVSQRIRGMVRFYAMNLNDSFLPLLLAKDSPFDFIFIRNLLMYLVPKAASRVVEQLFHLLGPDGYLTFSPADLARIPKTVLSHPKDSTFLSRAEAAVPALRQVETSPAVLSSPPSQLPELASRRGRSSPPRTSILGGNSHFGAMLAEVKRLSDSGELTRAKAAGEELLRHYPNAPPALFLAALVELELEQSPAAERLLHRALEREPDFALAHFALAVLLKRQGRVAESRARLIRLSRMLDGVPPETVLGGPEEISCGWLRSLVRHHLDVDGDPALK